MNLGYEQIFRCENLSDMVRCSENYMPTVFELMSIVATKVGVSIPEVCAYNDLVMNAYTYGEDNTLV